MAITDVHQQALAALTHSNHTLICFPEQVRGDGVGSALGLARALESLRPGHQVDVVSSGFADAHRQRYGFLPGVERVQPTIEQLHELMIRIPLSGAQIRDVRHEVRDGHLELRCSPASGQLTADHVEAALSAFRYDLVITVDCADLASLGRLYAAHPAFFQSTPTIAIDHDPAHERYAQINCIDLAAVACSEVCAHFLRAVAPDHMDADAATCLLTGILAETRGFRTRAVTPRTLAVMTALLEAGARREDVQAALFRTRTVPQLTLWGRALTRLRVDADRKLVWTILSQGDFLATGAHETDLHEVIDELLVTSPDAQVIILLHEQRDRTVCVIVRSPSGQPDAAALLRPIGGSGTAHEARACLAPQELPVAERVVVNHVRQGMGSDRSPHSTSETA